MSHNRSGLVAGLISGVVAMLVGATVVGSAIYFQDRLPAVMWSGDGIPLLTALGLVTGLMVALAVSLVRPGGLTVPLMAAILGGGGVAAGFVGGVAASRMAFAGDAIGAFPRIFVAASSILTQGFDQTWPLWLSTGVAALAALVLVALRVRRVRRAREEPAKSPEKEDTPDYRAPFEPAQQPTADLFTPRKPTRG
ncbi:hypothetical protein ITP53_28265 [Nonomuraea sp. K274]|uniref:Uncharacterized protein n=1 Tax=Nonomuraea cypriaca TaxID=1187855 RepID=A0A931F2X7_9ACTN|nr:hypothetical protein [Nonomuraea cypriaca]MBF8189561.1 hypothetical protein [Nonomuraea cypriaca]